MQTEIALSSTEEEYIYSSFTSNEGGDTNHVVIR